MSERVQEALITAVVICLAMLFVTCQARAGDFSDAAQVIEGKQAVHDQRLDELQGLIEILQGNVSELDQRLQQLEEGWVPEPPEPPGPEPVCTSVSEVEPGQAPFNGGHIIKGPSTRIEAEDYDLGGEGVAYHENNQNTVNSGGAYRTTESVDLKAASDDQGGQFAVGWGYTGEWLEFTVCVEPGIYDIGLRTACGAAACGDLQISLGGQVLGTVASPPTGAWDTAYQTSWLRGFALAGGSKILRVTWLGQPGDLNWIEFKEAPQALNHPPTDILLCDVTADGIPFNCS